jgi:hypothetical protein
VFFPTRALFRSRARNQESERPGISRDVRRFQLTLGLSGLIRHHAIIQKISQSARFDREIYVLGYVAGRFDKFQCVQFCRNHSDNLATIVQERAPAVTRLNRGTDLQIASIVQDAAE